MVQTPTPKQSKVLPQAVFLTSPVCISLFHALKTKFKDDMKWGSPAELAASFTAYFEEAKGTLWMDRFLSGQQLSWSGFIQEITLHSLKGHLNFHLSDGKSLPSQEEIQMWFQTLGASELPSHAAEDLSVVSDGHEVGDADENSLPSSFCLPSQKRSLAISMAPSSFVEEEYQLYKKYQMRVHGDSPSKCTRNQYSIFLIETPLSYVPPSEGHPAMGSFHMQYRIDDRLVAVGVVDVLPRCLSSKYLFWDPDFAPLALGKVSALSEIQWVQNAQKTFPDLTYYYMGFYIQSCPKMRYKGDYEPSELLCPESYHWVQLTDDVRECLQDNAYLNLATIPGAEMQENAVLSLPQISDLESQRVCVSGTDMTFEAYLQQLRERWQQSWGPSLLGWRQQRQSLRTESITAFLTQALQRWRSQVDRVANALIYMCMSPEQLAAAMDE